MRSLIPSRREIVAVLEPAPADEFVTLPGGFRAIKVSREHASAGISVSTCAVATATTLFLIQPGSRLTTRQNARTSSAKRKVFRDEQIAEQLNAEGGDAHEDL